MQNYAEIVLFYERNGIPQSFYAPSGKIVVHRMYLLSILLLHSFCLPLLFFLYLFWLMVVIPERTIPDLSHTLSYFYFNICQLGPSQTRLIHSRHCNCTIWETAFSSTKKVKQYLWAWLVAFCNSNFQQPGLELAIYVSCPRRL